MISSVKTYNGSKRITISGNAKVVLELPEGLAFLSRTTGGCTVVSIVKEDGFSIYQDIYNHPVERNPIEEKLQPVQENPDILRKKRKFSPRLTPEQKAEVVRLYKEEGMKKSAIAKKMEITFQQVNYCIKSA